MMYIEVSITFDPNTHVYIATYVLVLMYAQNQQYHKLLYKNTLHLDEGNVKVYGLSILDHHSKESNNIIT